LNKKLGCTEISESGLATRREAKLNSLSTA